jgi:hypothetical protein
MMPTDGTAAALFATSAHALARAGTHDAGLTGLLEALIGHLEIGSAAIFAVPTDGGPLELEATAGLSEPAAAGLAAAVRDPAHPIPRTVIECRSSFDVLPMAPGGPKLRSHVPLIATRGGVPAVVGVLAVAHDAPMTTSAKLVEAIADLGAAAISLSRN